MNLLDFPPEIFQRIVECHVARVDVDEAWENRMVCKTFNAYISEEIFGRLPIERLRLRLRRPRHLHKILERNMACYLAYRSKYAKPCETRSHMVLPALVRDVFEKISSIEEVGSNEQTTLKQVVLAVIKHCPEAYSIAMHPLKGGCFTRTEIAELIPRFSDDGTNENALCIAIALQNKELISRLVADGASLWHKTAAFGLPLKVATKTQNLEIVELVMKYCDQDVRQTSVPEATRAKYLTDIIMRNRSDFARRTTFSGDTTAYSQLAHWYMDHLRKPSFRVREIFFAWCIHWKDSSLMERVLQYPITPKLMEDLYPRNYFSHFPDPKILSLLVIKNILRVNGMHCIDMSSGYTRHSGVLHHAIAYSHLPTVRKALDMGADSNLRGPYPDSKTRIEMKWPLRRAIEKRNKKIVKLLLDRGADPECGTEPGTSCTLELSKTYRPLLVEAIERKIARLGAEYHIPDGHVRCYKQHLSPQTFAVLDKAYEVEDSSRLFDLDVWLEELQEDAGKKNTT